MHAKLMAPRTRLPVNSCFFTFCQGGGRRSTPFAGIQPARGGLGLPGDHRLASPDAPAAFCAVPWCPVVLQETRRQGDGKEYRAGPWRTGLAAGVVWGPCWSFWRVFTKKMLSRGVPWLSRGVPWHGAWSRGPVVPWSTGRAQANGRVSLSISN